MSAKKKYLCPTPQEQCTGRLVSMNNFFNYTKNAKVHVSPDAAFACYVGYLKSTGHTRVSSREFLRPEGGLLLLTRRSRFGTALRLGKEGNRYMVLKHNGCIVSS